MSVDSGERWYRNPWVWLVIAIPALTVAGGIVTLYLALSHPHILVGDSAGNTANAPGTPAPGHD